MLKKIIKLLEGRKSYIVSVLAAIYTLLKVLKIIVTTSEIDVAVYGLLGAIFGITITAHTKKK